MDKWLTLIQNDDKPAEAAVEKVVRNKPAEAMDACYTASLEKITDQAKCREMFLISL